MENSEFNRAFDSLANMIEISKDEQRLLAALKPLADVTGQDFARTFCRVFLEKQDLALLTREDYINMLDRTEAWFCQLFDGPSEIESSRLVNWNGVDHIALGVPIRTLLALVPLVLEWGQKLAAHSPKPEKALTAFWKTLSHDIASHQVYGELHMNYLRELVLEEELY